MITLLVNIIMAMSVEAHAAELHWVQMPNAPQKMVIAVEDGKTKEQALMAYIEAMEESQELSKFIATLKETAQQDLSWGQIEPSVAKPVMLLANSVEDMSKNPERLLKFQTPFAQAGAEVYVMPVAGLKALSESEQKDAANKVSEKMMMVTAMGGADISPELYGRYNAYSNDVNHERDVWEAKLLKSIIEQEKAFVLGICRGHQMVAVTQGMSLIQDIPSFIGSKIDHANGRHDIAMMNTELGMLQKMTGKSQVVEVNSIHHQSVKFKEGTQLVPAAFSPDGVVEAFEFKNGKGLTVQFHPEKMDEAWATEMLRNAVRISAQSVNKCELLLNAS